MPKRGARQIGPLRGGLRQRLAADAAATGPARASHLATLLVEKWSWGKYSAVEVQEIALAATRDGNSHSDVQSLATMGASGAVPGNCHRDMLRRLSRPPLADALYSVQLFYRAPPAGTVFQEQSMLFPHELFACMYTHHREAFVERLCGSTAGKVEAFWRAMETHPNMPTHPLRLRENYLTRCIPLSLHGDGVPVAGIGKSWSKSVECYSWSSLLYYGRTLDSNFLMFFLYKQLCVTDGAVTTIDQVWTALSWSLHALFTGLWPSHDWQGRAYPRGTRHGDLAGTPLAEGWFAAVWVLRGDLEYFWQTLRLEHPNSNSPCVLCRCNTTTVPWTDFRRGTGWEAHVWQPAAWLHARPGRHQLFRLPGISVCSVVPDLMHTKHLGVDAYVYGSCLSWLVRFVLPGDANDNLQVVTEMLKRAYRELHSASRFGTLRFSMFESADHFPKLKGKANELRHLGPALLKVVEGVMDSADRTHRQVRLALRCSCRLEALLDEHDRAFKLPPAAAAEWESAVYDLLALVTALANEFHPRGIMLWHITIKSHYLLHLGKLVHHINPRLGWCYAGEDFVGRLKLLVQAAHRGTPAHLVVNKVLLKYALGMGYNLMDRRQWFA
jgi:hypothetical protein